MELLICGFRVKLMPCGRYAEVLLDVAKGGKPVVPGLDVAVAVGGLAEEAGRGEPGGAGDPPPSLGPTFR